MKSKTIRDLESIARLLRRDTLEMTSAAGSGHPTSCLSCAEIVAALFFHEMSFDSNNPRNPENDELILSKGHAAPILYAALRRAGAITAELSTLRKLSSPLEGHPMPRASPWIKVAAGSLGQGLAVGVGMALAARLQKLRYRTYVLMGDSEQAEGSVHEACALAAHYRLSQLIAIVDVNRLGQRGETMFGHNLNAYEAVYRAAGWSTFVIDGHDITALLHALEQARHATQPAVILAKTFKGKGVSFLENREGWHGKALTREQLAQALAELPLVDMPHIAIPQPPRGKEIHDTPSKSLFPIYTRGEMVSTRAAYGAALAALARSDKSVLAIDAEVSNSTHADAVRKNSPEQFIEAYIAEQSMIGMALGLSKKGHRVFASTFAAFLTRAADQLRMAALSNASFTVCGSHSGVSIGEDGASQMGLEDIALFRALPNTVVFYPSDAIATQKLVALAATLPNITYLRTTRGATPVIYKATERFSVGGFKILKQSAHDKATLIGAGVTVHEALRTAALLAEKKFTVAVIDLYCIKPLNTKKLAAFVQKHGKYTIVAEDHHPEGGIGEAVAAALINTNCKLTHLAVLGIPHSGTPAELLEKYGISAKGIARAAQKL